MKLTSINITLSEKAHKNLKRIVQETDTNQSEILNAVLEKIDVSKTIKEAREERDNEE